MRESDSSSEGATMRDRVNSQTIRTMARSIARGDAVFFIGAGMSANAGAPTWDELMLPLRHELELDPNDDASPALVAQFYANRFGERELHKYLRLKLRAPSLKPTEAHELLCNLPVSVFVTTNYDDLLEAALRRVDRRYHVICDETEMKLWNEDDEVQVLKLHGDLSAARSIVLTDWDFVRFHAEKAAFKRKLTEIFCNHHVIFIGYGLRDPNVSLILNTVSHEFGSLKKESFIVTFDANVHRQGEWRRRGMLPVNLAATSETEARGDRLRRFLAELLREVNATNRSVLLVDDNVDLLVAWKRLLEREIEGVRVETATDGLAAAMRFGQLRPRLVVVDLQMPRLDGWEFIALIRQFASDHGTQIIAVSGDRNNWDADKAEALGVEEFVEKTEGDGHSLCARAKKLLGVRTGVSGYPASMVEDSDELTYPLSSIGRAI
jgi:CheY-like chemotaxis protein